MDFADKIKFLREEILNISQVELAKKLSVSRTSIYNWENGVSKPSVENIKTISLLCGLTTDYLIKEDYPLEISINYPGAEPTNVHWTFATGYFKTFAITTLIVFVHRNLVYLDFSHILLLLAHLRCAPRLTQKKRHSKNFLPKAVSSLQDVQQICVLLLYF